MSIINALFYLVAGTLIVSYGTGLIIGGPRKAKKIITWELRELLGFSRWALKGTVKAIGNFCHWLAPKI